jgi:hypothetical protein
MIAEGTIKTLFHDVFNNLPFPSPPRPAHTHNSLQLTNLLGFVETAPRALTNQPALFPLRVDKLLVQRFFELRGECFFEPGSVVRVGLGVVGCGRGRGIVTICVLNVFSLRWCATKFEGEG